MRENVRYRPPAGKKRFLSISPLGGERGTLAPYWGASDNQPLPGAWATRAPDSPEVHVKTAECTVEEGVDMVMAKLQELGYLNNQ